MNVPIGHLIGMIKTIAWDIRYYLLILLLVLYSFSQALFILSYDNPSGSAFSSADTALMSAYAYMNGGASYPPQGFENSRNPSLAIFLVASLVFVTTILMLNLLISLMGNSYQKVQDKADAEWRKELAAIITSQVRFYEPKLTKYIHYLKREEDSKKEFKEQNGK